jgi:hypothetical protein
MATEQKLCFDLEHGASQATRYRDATRVNNDEETTDDLGLESLAYMNDYKDCPETRLSPRKSLA